VTDDTPKTAKEQLKEIPQWFKTKAKSICRKKILYKRVPILNWLPKYNTEDAVGDLVAGFTVGLTVIPQALAYAGIAQLPAAYGLYGSFLGCFIYIFLGSCKDVPMGKSFNCLRCLMINYLPIQPRPHRNRFPSDLPNSTRQLGESLPSLLLDGSH
jgi:hypothetical protein